MKFKQKGLFKFNVLALGEVFKIDNFYYMRISLTQEGCNAVNLNSGGIVHFQEELEVSIVRGTFVEGE